MKIPRNTMKEMLTTMAEHGLGMNRSIKQFLNVYVVMSVWHCESVIIH